MATDLSKRSDAGVARAARLAGELGAALHLIYVIDDGLPPRIAQACDQNARETLQEQIDAAPRLREAKPQILIDVGRPWDVILDAADQCDADLIVAGLHRDRGLAGLFGGSTLHRIACTGTRPVLMVSEPPSGPYTRAIVGVDFSDCARRAANAAAALVRDHPLTLVHGYRIPFGALARRRQARRVTPAQDKKLIETEIHTRMWEFVATLDAPHRGTGVTAREGDPAKVLTDEAHRLHAELVAVGAHSRAWIAEAIIGSTAEKLLSFPPCDVLVAPLR